MSDANERLLERLSHIGFQVRAGGISPFGEELPLVTGIAWDTATAQVAFVAEMSVEDDVEAWRQLLFAGSGLRHHLAGDGPAAFGTPVILAIVDDSGERRLRTLTEDLAQHYALFNRVDLNLVRYRDLEDEDALDIALAPLLPRCRMILGQEISRGEVQRFWDMLRHEVQRTAVGLPDIFDEFREAAGRDCAAAIIGGSEAVAELPSPTPLTSIELENFRSFANASIGLAPISIVHGPNGGGKSSVLEALELAWAHRSQRQPDDVGIAEYARHLPRNGTGEFVIRGDGDQISSLDATPNAELGRCILTQETVADLVGSSPEQRYAALLTTTGLEIPDLKFRTAELVAATKREADAALTAAGLPPLRRSDSDGRKHLVNVLAGGFASRLPPPHDLAGLEQTVERTSGGTFASRDWSDDEAAAALARADALVATVLTDADDGGAVAEALDEALEAVQRLALDRRNSARAARLLLDAMSVPETPGVGVKVEAPIVRPATAGIPAGLAVRWLSHSRALNEAAAQFRADAKELKDARWGQRLARYADALMTAAEIAPRADLEPLARRSTARTAARLPRAAVSEALYLNAGFSRPPTDPHQSEAALGELAQRLQQQAEALEALAADLAQHPARQFGDHAPRVLRAICRYEVARNLRREGPIMRASEELVEELLQGRLAPVLRELVAAIVRFEWYFKPLRVPKNRRTLVLGGLSTSEPDLDARLVLNSAERSVVGLAWFLALHLLQPPERRRVLVLDDPAAVFDSANQAGYVATLRAFVRLIRPEQVVVASHDDGLAALLAEELAPVDGWPSEVIRIRCQRDADDTSTASVAGTITRSRATEEEISMLGLPGESALFA